MFTGHATVESAIEGMKLGAYRLPHEALRYGPAHVKVQEASAKKRQHEEKIIQARVKEITSRRA